VFDWEPKYGVYRETFVVDGETTELEDWFIAQGHVKTPTLSQMLKNAWIELKFGLDYYDFPWNWRAFFGSLLAWGLFILAFSECLKLAMKNSKGRKPIPINYRFGNDEKYDILWYFGAREHKGDASPSVFKRGLYRPLAAKSELAREDEWRRRHHMPERRPKPPSEYSHTLYSNTRSRTLKKNKERHKRFLKEREEERKRVAKWKKQVRNMETEEVKKRRIMVKDGFSVAKEEKKEVVGVVLSPEEKELITNMRKDKARLQIQQ